VENLAAVSLIPNLPAGLPQLSALYA
jgi:hypothetical protein